MRQIRIKWEHVSPFLKSLVGEVTIHDVEWIPKHTDKIIAKFTVTKNEFSYGYKFDTSETRSKETRELIEEVKPQIRSMVECYYSGLLLENSIYHWIDENEKEKP